MTRLFGSQIVTVLLLAATAALPAGENDDKQKEARLVAVLKSQAPQADKEAACRDLRIVGREDAVPVLAGLLLDKDLWAMARYALEPMPYPTAGTAFRDALAKTTGPARIAIINSISVRRDEAATPALVGLLRGVDAATVVAAAALGNIGTSDCAKALADFRPAAPKAIQADLGEAILNAGEHLIADKKLAQAGPLFEALQDAAYPKHIRMGVFRGLAAARPDQAPAMLLAAMVGADRTMANLAAQILTELPADEKSTALYAERLPTLPPAGQMALLRALAKRKDPAARAAITQAAKSTDKDVRVTALAAFGATGEAGDVALLAGLLAAADKETADQARTSLAMLSGPGVSEAIAQCAAKSAGPMRAQLVAALGRRGAKECADAVVKAMDDSDPAVRAAALGALVQIGGQAQLAPALKTLRTSSDASEQTAAEEAVLAIAARAGDDALPAVQAAMSDAKSEVRVAMVRALGRIGSAKALAAVTAALKTSEGDAADEVVRVLGNWPTAQAAPTLLDIARKASKMTHKVLAIRGYIRLAAAEKDPAAKAKMLAQANQLPQRVDEKKLLISAWGTLRTPQALEYVTPFVGQAGVQQEAADAAIKIADEIGKQHPAAAKAAMQKVLAASKDKKSIAAHQQVLDGLK